MSKQQLQEQDGFLQFISNVMKTSRMQVSFLVCFTVTLAGLVPFTHRCYHYIVKSKKEAPPDYEFPELADLKEAFLFMMFFFVTHYLWVRMVTPLVEPIIKIQDDKHQLKIRSKKVAMQMFGIIVFGASSIFGYTLLKDQDFFPKSLGGSGDLWNTFEDNFPYQRRLPGMRTYYMLNLGWHLQSILEMILIDGLRAADVIEMILHHIVTAYLVSGSYLINLFRIGAIVEWMHDSSDVFLAIARLFQQTRFRKTSYVTMTLCLSAWIYLRIYVFSQAVYVVYASNSKVMKVESGEDLILTFFVYGLGIILVLNCWWAQIMLSISLKALKSGKSTDDREVNFQKKVNKKQIVG